MRSRRAIVHEGASCAPEVASLIETSSQLFSTVHLVLSEPIETDVSILLFSDLNLFLLDEPVYNSARTHGLMIEQIMKLLVIDFEECTFYDNVGFVLSFLDFLKDELYDSWYDSQLFLLDSDGIAASHSKCFAATSLSISQDGCIITLEASED